MPLLRWKMFAGFALLGVLAAPVSAQRIGQPFATFTIGGTGSHGGNFANRNGFTADALLGAHIGRSFRSGQRPHLALAATVGDNGGYIGEDCIVASGASTNGCTPDMPRFRYFGLVAGPDLRGSGGSISFLAGPTAMSTYSMRWDPHPAHSAFAIAARVDAFLNLPTGHAAIGISARNLLAPNFQSAFLNSHSFSLGLRFQ